MSYPAENPYYNEPGHYAWQNILGMIKIAKFQIGEIVRHRVYDFRGIIYDVDPVFSNTEEWYNAIPEEVRPRRDQPFYHLFAENSQTTYEAYVSEQNLLSDNSEEQLRHPAIARLFLLDANGDYQYKNHNAH